jgi:hypothetical protein
VVWKEGKGGYVLRLTHLFSANMHFFIKPLQEYGPILLIFFSFSDLLSELLWQKFALKIRNEAT